ncbi:MAG: type II toxin-antitoxin system VapC family toxin [Bifidobacteriaceae bacterium]|nr:type II toxin-antitoxin system VapC family toxin [Bifidobacteriaceae bacterium]
MIGLDTNVLVRFVTGDDPVQSRLAERAIADLSTDHPGYVTLITTAELTWALRATYKMSRSQVSQVIRGLLETQELVFEDSDMVARALQVAGQAGCDLADALIALRAARAGCSSTITFDRRASRILGMELLDE